MSEAPIKFWSFSSLKNFERCPYSLYLQRVERSPAPPPREDDPRDRGTRVHNEAEAFVKGEGPLTKDLKKFEAKFNELQEAYNEGRVELEKNWLFDANWAPADWDNKVCIVKLDAGVRLSETTYRFIDYKTGKSWGKEVAHTQQGQMYAIGTFMRFPEIAVCESSFWYLDEGKPSTRTYTRVMLPTLIERWQARADRLLTATDFPPKPNRSNCKYCDFGLNVGTGACSYAVGD